MKTKVVKKLFCTLIGTVIMISSIKPELFAAEVEDMSNSTESITESITDEYEFSKEQQVVINRIVQKAGKDAAETAVELNNVDDNNVYEYTLKSVLEKYYNLDNSLMLSEFEKTVDSKASDIIEEYEEAQKKKEVEASKQEYDPDCIIVGFEPNTSSDYVKGVAKRNFGSVVIVNNFGLAAKSADDEFQEIPRRDVSKISNDTVAVIDISEGQTVEEAIKAYGKFDNVKYVEPDYYQVLDDVQEQLDGEEQEEKVLSNDKYVGRQYYLDKIKIDEGWKSAKKTNYNQIKVAVLDSGLDINHVDLKNMYINSASVDMTMENTPRQ